MREIKFRVWDNEENNFWGEGRSLSLVSLVSDSVVNDDSTVLEQYTGLKDKNGVEIYENDIVDTHWGNEENRLVKYDNEMGFYLTKDQDQHYWTAAYKGEYEVIGNIHENSDLLEEQS